MEHNEIKDDLDPIVDMLTPKAFPKVPENLKINVLPKIEKTMKNRLFKIVISTAAAVVAAALVVVSLKPANALAADVIDRSLAGAAQVQTMVMTVEVRTRPQENFSYIELSEPMVGHRLTVVRSEPLKWRLDREGNRGRHIVFDGTDKYMWLDRMGHKGDASSNFEAWFDILVNPEMVPMREKAAMQEGEVKYKVEEIGGETILRADVKAKGDFTNNYLLNTSIGQSDTRREIVFDSSTGLLKALRIFVKDGGAEVLVVDVKNIDYNIPVNETALVEVPEGVDWIDAMVAPEAGCLADISAEEAAQLIADGINAGDLESVHEAFGNYDLKFVGNYFAGTKVVKLDKPFRSGQYPGLFVPFEIEMPSGETKHLNLALRNDNPNKVWIVDGGL